MTWKTAARAMALSGLLLGTTNCLLSPYNNQVFSSESNITFVGASPTPGSKIDIQACAYGEWGNQLCAPQDFVTIATLNAATTASFTDSYQVKWYLWKTVLAIPPQYWHRNGPMSPSTLYPATATVRVFDNGGDVYYYLNDPRDCPAPDGTAQLISNDPRCGQLEDTVGDGQTTRHVDGVGVVVAATGP